MRRDLRFRVRSFDILGAKYLINEIIAEVDSGDYSESFSCFPHSI